MAETQQSDSEAENVGQSIWTAGRSAGGRILSFSLVYVAIFVFIVMYIITVRAVEYALDTRLQEAANQAVIIAQLDAPVATQIRDRMNEAVEASPWITWGGAQTTSLVLGNDGLTWLYVQGQVPPQPEGLDPTDVLRQAVDLLPATAVVTATVPHNSLIANGILISYAAILLWGLYAYNRTNNRRHQRAMEDALRQREDAASRAESIQSELASTRQRLASIEPADQASSVEIRDLQTERRTLQKKLAWLTTREEELRGHADQALELSQEVRALEDLLEEAAGDLSSKDDEIRSLEQNLRKATKAAGPKGRNRGSEALARRLKTLYPTLEIDPHATDNMVALRDETRQLKAEEQLKRLCEEADNVSVRRKVGGLPEHLTIFELGFAGKGRIYYSRGKQARFRILAIGAKNTQDSDMEYLRRLSREDMA
ncbi:MAG: hypothetical protein P8M78_00540 [Myxococcota bacterium]|nr:hypothetical protein [Myxococcota bacterium]